MAQLNSLRLLVRGFAKRVEFFLSGSALKSPSAIFHVSTLGRCKPAMSGKRKKIGRNVNRNQRRRNDDKNNF